MAVNPRRNKNVYAAMETFIVPSSDAATVSGTLMSSGNVLTLGDGRIGIQSRDFDGTIAMNVLKTTQNSSDVKSIAVLQGTPNSIALNQVSAFGIGHKAFVASGELHNNKIVRVSNSKYHPGQYSGQLLDALTDIATEINYTAFLALESVKRDREFGRMNTDILTASVTLPTGLTDDEDYLLQNVAAQLNSHATIMGGNRPFVILAIKEAGGSGTAINAISLGDVVPVMLVNGVTYSVTVDKAMFWALVQLDAIHSAATIEVINVLTAGDAAKVDALYTVGLDEVAAVLYDDTKQVKVTASLTLSRPEGYTSDYAVTKVADPIEVRNSGAKLGLLFDSKARMQQFSLENTEACSPILQAPTYISPTGIYNVVIVEYYDSEAVISGGTYEVKRIYFLIPATDSTDYSSALGAVAVPTIVNAYTTLATSLDVNFAAWVGHASATYKSVDYSLEYGTETAFFTI